MYVSGSFSSVSRIPQPHFEGADLTKSAPSLPSPTLCDTVRRTQAVQAAEIDKEPFSAHPSLPRLRQTKPHTIEKAKERREPLHQTRSKDSQPRMHVWRRRRVQSFQPIIAGLHVYRSKNLFRWKTDRTALIRVEGRLCLLLWLPRKRHTSPIVIAPACVHCTVPPHHPFHVIGTA